MVFMDFTHFYRLRMRDSYALCVCEVCTVPVRLTSLHLMAWRGRGMGGAALPNFLALGESLELRAAQRPPDRFIMRRMHTDADAEAPLHMHHCEYGWR